MLFPPQSKVSLLNELSNLIKHNLQIDVTPEPLEKFLSYLEKNSFDFDLFGYYTMQAHEFFHDSNLIDVEISEKKMKKFLEKNLDYYRIVGEEIMKKIITYAD